MRVDKNEELIYFDTSMNNEDLEGMVTDILAGYKCPECRTCPHINKEVNDED